MTDLLLGLGLFALILIVVLLIVPFYFWIKQIIRLSKKEDKTNMWICFLIGFFFSPLIGWIVGSFLGKEEENKERY